MNVQESFFRDFLRIIIWFPLRWICAAAPVRISFAIFRLLGTIHFCLSGSKRRRLSMNISRAFPEMTSTQIQAAIKDNFQNHYIDRLHIFTYPKLKKPANFNKIAQLEGLEHLETTLKQGRGAILVLGHYGVIQLPLFELGLKGYPIVQIGLPSAKGLSWIGRKVAFELRLKYEEMIPATIVPANQFLRKVFTILAQNGLVMMNIDPAGGGEWIGKMISYKMFGQPIPIPLGSANLSLKTKAPILTVSASITNDARYVYKIHAQRDPDSETPEIIARDIATWYERQIAKRPGLWHFWDEYEPGKLIWDQPENL